MRKKLVGRVVGIVGVCLLTSGIASGQEVKKFALDDSASIGLKIQTDAKVKVEGKASVKVTTAWPTTVCLGEVTKLDIEQVKLVFKAQVKTELEGDAFLEMWVHVGGGQFFSRGLIGRPFRPPSCWVKARNQRRSH